MPLLRNDNNGTVICQTGTSILEIVLFTAAGLSNSVKQRQPNDPQRIQA